MQRVSGRLGFSASDLVTFLGCRHASALNRRYFDEPWEMTRPSPSQKLLQDKGIAHELAYLEFLEDSGREVVRIPNRSDRVRLTLKALRDGADVIYQAALEDGAWYGESDFLVRTDTPSALGGWSYEAVDAKLAQQVSPRHVVQLSVYSSLLANIQDLRPARMSIVLGSGMTEVLRTDDFASYVTLAGRRMLEFHTGATMPPTKPEPCAQCALCRWRERCEDEWETADHLSLVANIRVTQAAKLRAAGVDTVAKLGVLPPGQRIPGMAPETLERLRSQARLQVSVRGTDGHRYELLPPQPGRDFSRMPKPAEGDLFFDMEGDPLYPGGLEYLFGVHWGDPAGGTFRAFWAHDREEERRALEEFLDFVRDHLALYPDAHIYHYNHYEPTVVRRLCMSHATREAILDDLLRRRKFVDLFKVVREALLISEPRYSLKNVEVFYREKREGEVANAGDSIVAYETWRATGWARLLTDIELYNAIDCRSTAELRD